MPFYTQLPLRETDSEAVRIKKRRVATKLLTLRAALSAHLHESGSVGDRSQSVRIATWNLREFGGTKYGGRDDECLYYIAEIISPFDIVALQEIREDLGQFLDLLKILGPDWGYLATDVTDGHAGNGERMVYLYNRRRVQFRHIAGELTLPEGGKVRAAFGERILLRNGFVVNLPAGAAPLSGVHNARLASVADGKKLDADVEIPLPPGSTLSLPEGTSLVVTRNTRVSSPGRGKAQIDVPADITGDPFRLRFPERSFDDSLRQFARTPFLISFQAGWLKLNLATVHIYYGADDPAQLEQRRSEIELLTAALANKAQGEFAQDKEAFLGVLGDFNIIGAGHPTMSALESSGFLIPEALKAIPGSNVERNKAYDQIAFWEPRRAGGYARLDVRAANVFDFFEHVMHRDEEAVYRAEAPDNGMKETTRFADWRTYKMSDHLPMWIELRSDFGEEYLRAIDAP